MNKFSFYIFLFITIILLVTHGANGRSLDDNHVKIGEIQPDYNEDPRYIVVKNHYKRERPLQMSGYGWDECEFSPLSCLLKKRNYSK
uniref:Uncharacterized protein n=1 Tax=Strongyloides papillosus TaxID=174720 RepID=A0A0N5B7F7_STREA